MDGDGWVGPRMPRIPLASRIDVRFGRKRKDELQLQVRRYLRALPGVSKWRGDRDGDGVVGAPCSSAAGCEYQIQSSKRVRVRVEQDGGEGRVEMDVAGGWVGIWDLGEFCCYSDCMI